MLSIFKDKTVTVLGAAKSGIAAANLLWFLKARVKISDQKSLEIIEKELSFLQQRDHVVIEAGGHTKEFITQSDFIVLSPGIPWNAKAIGWAKEAGIKIIPEIELASMFCPCPIIAITGSNGKTTTSTLAAAMLKGAGKNVYLCGNIGIAFCDIVLSLKPQDFVVLELSSFQLQAINDFKPHVAVWTNFSQNHLDRHVDMKEYFDAKAQIFKHQTVKDNAVINMQQQECLSLTKNLKAHVAFFNTPEQLQEINNPNFWAAFKAIESLGVSLEKAKEVFKQFKGVEHRLEEVATIEGTIWINDSKSTTVESGRWALERMPRKVILICGGLDKHLDYRPLRDLVKQKVEYLIAIGQARDLIKNAFGDLVGIETHTDFKQAIMAAHAKAHATSIILLSPMCASFDMFKNFEDRGQQFKEMVLELKSKYEK